MRSSIASFNEIEDMFDRKLKPLNDSICKLDSRVNAAFYGNGKKGLFDRVDTLEDVQKNMLGKIGMISAFFGLMIAGMFEIITKFFSKKMGL